jgi:hypothetical protein
MMNSFRFRLRWKWPPVADQPVQSSSRATHSSRNVFVNLSIKKRTSFSICGVLFESATARNIKQTFGERFQSAIVSSKTDTLKAEDEGIYESLTAASATKL